MPALLLIANSAFVYVFLSALGVILLVSLGYLARYLIRRRSAQSQTTSLEAILLRKETPVSAPDGTEVVETRAPVAKPLELPFTPELGVAARILKAALIVLACVVAAGFILILLPQETIDAWAQALRLRAAPATTQEEPIAFLFLGDEIRPKEFHIRGVVRNISAQPIEKLDAVIRLYSSEGKLIETAIVRMDAEVIAPDATSTFHLVYPDFAGQFASYSADFKLRNGDPVPFKDMRGAR
jgi:hypothetical protein